MLTAKQKRIVIDYYIRGNGLSGKAVCEDCGDQLGYSYPARRCVRLSPEACRSTGSRNRALVLSEAPLS